MTSKRSINRTDARAELRGAKDAHLELLSEIRKRAIDDNPNRDKYLHLMAVPVVYAIWEGYFKAAMGVCFKRVHSPNQRPRVLDHRFSTLWLQKESFVSTFLQQLLNAMNPGASDDGKPKPGKFNALAQFSQSISSWLSNPMPVRSFTDLVMTFSNVNERVVKVNADVIDLDISSVDFSHLNQLLSLRNDLSHGGLVQLPDNAVVVRLLAYTKTLIEEFDAAVVAWLTRN